MMLHVEKKEKLSDYGLSDLRYEHICDYVELTVVPYMKKHFPVVKQVYYEAWVDLWDYLVPSVPSEIRKMPIQKAACEIAEYLVSQHNKYCQYVKLSLSAGE